MADSTRLIAAGSGFLPESWMEELTTGAVVARLARSRGRNLWAKCPPQGLRELRETLSAKLQQQGIAAGVDNLMTTVGASQAFDLLCRSLLAPGDAVLVEDDVYGDLYEGSAVRLAQIDGLRHVIYVGSYTKLIGPALRVGFVAADAALISQLVERKVLSVLSGSTLLECFVSEVLGNGRYKRHVEQMRGRLARMRRDARRALESAGVRFEAAHGEGMFLWGRVPEAVSVDELVRRAREHSILLARGTLFSPAGGCVQWLRFNVAHSNSPRLVQFLEDALLAA